MIFAALALVACGKKPATKELFGIKVTPPGLLAKIKPGMTLAEMKAIAPDATEDKRAGWLIATPSSDVKLYASVLDGFVIDTYADVEGNDRGLDLVTAAWGPPDAENDRHDKTERAWRSIETGWRAQVFCGGTGKTPPFCWVRFHPHQPISAMFTKQVTPPGAFAKVKIGMTTAELEKVTGWKGADKWAPRDLDFDGVTQHAHVIDGKLDDLSYFVPRETFTAAQKAWGPGKTDGDLTTWFDPSTGWIAQMKTSTREDSLDLNYFSYTPFDKEMDLLAELSHMKTLADAQKAHPELTWRTDKRPARVDLLVNELSVRDALSLGTLMLGIWEDRDGLRISIASPGNADDIVPALTKRWGEPKKDSHVINKDLNETNYRWPQHARFTVLSDATGSSTTLSLPD